MFKTLNKNTVSRIGLGTWYLGDDSQKRREEISALRAGIDAGANLLDTAEMYGEGRAEELLGEAISPYDRDSLYIVSKVYPWNAGRENILTSCENSLQRLKTDYLDLYLLHWPGSIALEETIDCMEQLKEYGLIREWGVSNFDTIDMKDLWKKERGALCACNQVLYNMVDRGIEFDLLPALQERNIPLMAYCPLAQAGKLHNQMYKEEELELICKKHNIKIEQLMLAFLLQKEAVYPIPRSSSAEHANENVKAMQIKLDESDLAIIDSIFPPPSRKERLKVI